MAQSLQSASATHQGHVQLLVQSAVDGAVLAVGISHLPGARPVVWGGDVLSLRTDAAEVQASVPRVARAEVGQEEAGLHTARAQ
jgi:hypothetical protein